MAVDKLVAAWEAKLVDAKAKGGHDVVVWLPDEACWGVASLSDPATLRRVRRVNPPADRAEHHTDANNKKRSRGLIFFFYKCDCPASTKYLFCWHVAAVVLWCKEYRNYDPRVRPLDEQQDAQHRRNVTLPAPEQTATIMQVAGPSTDDLSDTLAMANDQRYLDQRYGPGTFDIYCRKVVDDGGNEAQAWLATLTPITAFPASS